MRSGACLLAALFCCVSLAFGQIGTSTISGRVTDPSGAVVPGVSVTVVNTDTNFQFSATTNSEGLYSVQSLQPGPYRVTFEATGFNAPKTMLQTGHSKSPRARGRKIDPKTST